MSGFVIGVVVGTAVAIYGNPKGWSLLKQLSVSVPVSIVLSILYQYIRSLS